MAFAPPRSDRLLQVLSEHGQELAALRHDLEALRRETELLRQTLKVEPKAKAEAKAKAKVEPKAVPKAKVEKRELRRPSTCSTSSSERCASGGRTPRAAAEELRRSRSQEARPKALGLYDLAQLVLRSPRRATALAAFGRCLQRGASPHRWEGPETPLRGAVQGKSVEMARLLMEAKASPNERLGEAFHLRGAAHSCTCFKKLYYYIL